jgi:hypothetical protein
MFCYYSWNKLKLQAHFIAYTGIFDVSGNNQNLIYISLQYNKLMLTVSYLTQYHSVTFFVFIFLGMRNLGMIDDGFHSFIQKPTE